MQKRVSPITKKRQAGKRSKKTFFGLLLLLAATPLLMGALCCSNQDTNTFFDPPPAQSTPTPQGDREFTQLYMLDDTTGWALSSASVLKTSDGGKSWTDVTPLDWEPRPGTGPQDPSQQAISGITNATFLDTNHAWIVASTPIQQSDISAQQTAVATAVTTNANGTTTVSGSQLPPDTTTIYVRSTVDGGHNWVTSNPITLKNVIGTSQPDFINTHEGWLEVMREDNQNNQTLGLLYHSVDGGITWQPDFNHNPFGDSAADPVACILLCRGIPNLFRTLPIVQTITDTGALTGMTILPDCIRQPNATNTQQSQQCPPPSTDQTLGCTVPGTQDYVGAATGTFTTQQANDVFLDTRPGAGTDWHLIAPIGYPGGAPQQSDKSVILSEPPVLLDNGAALLPIEIQNDPGSDGSSAGGASSTFLHLYGLGLKVGGKGYILLDLSPTSSFTVQEISTQHTLSAPDAAHVFVFGQAAASSNSTEGDWNLYEFNGKQWITLTSKTDTTIPAPQGDQQAEPLGSKLSNLDMISPTDGWATNGSRLYHLSVSGTTVTWSRVYPTSNQVSPGQVATPSRDPGTVVSAPQNPPICAAPPTKKQQNTNNSGNSNAQTHTLSFVNNTNQTIWVGASGATLPDHGNWNGELTPGQTEKLTVNTPGASLWSGRFWGRTGCDSQGMHCETGDCGAGGLCNGGTGALPASLAEFAFNGAAGQIYYDVSLVDGYNLPLLIHSSGGSSPDNCGAKACVDVNSICPGPLQDKNASGQVVGCKSACTAFGLDQYCCLGQYVSGVCNPDTWPSNIDSAKLFKDAYPHAYSYAYDDSTSTYTCDETCDFSMIFGLSATTAQQNSTLDPARGGSLIARKNSTSLRT